MRFMSQHLRARVAGHRKQTYLCLSCDSQEMNVEGLTRENVASHLQKWRLLEKKSGQQHSGRHSGGGM